MCGRYALGRSRKDLLDEFMISPEQSDEPLEVDYNIAPTKRVVAVLSRHLKEAPDEAEPTRQLRTLRWGLVPSWAKDIKIGARMINARVESVHTKPAYRRAFARRRCLLPADGFFEWQAPADDGTQRGKQPFFIRPRKGQLLAMAGLYEFWRDPAVAEGDPDAWLVTCTIITTQATDDLGHLHDRMPMTITPEYWDYWLDPTLTAPNSVRPLLEPATHLPLEGFPVSRAVNSVRNNGPQLLEPVALDQ